MRLLDGVNHIAGITPDLDRLTRFYRDVFDAEIEAVLDDGLRHAMIRLGPNTVLHPFELPAGVPLPDVAPMFRRGRLDHFALNATGEDAFQELRARIVAAGAGDGEIVDLGPGRSVGFRDPDGNELEVVLMKPGARWDAALPPSEWVRTPLPV